LVRLYCCIGIFKAHQDPASKDEVDSCYFQFVGADATNSSSGDIIGTHPESGSKSKIVKSLPRGVG
jgi:hypothetical protein